MGAATSRFGGAHGSMQRKLSFFAPSLEVWAYHVDPFSTDASFCMCFCGSFPAEVLEHDDTLPHSQSDAQCADKKHLAHRLSFSRVLDVPEDRAGGVNDVPRSTLSERPRCRWFKPHRENVLATCGSDEAPDLNILLERVSRRILWPPHLRTNNFHISFSSE